jgi:hypothetical protein
MGGEFSVFSLQCSGNHKLQVLDRSYTTYTTYSKVLTIPSRRRFPCLQNFQFAMFPGPLGFREQRVSHLNNPLSILWLREHSEQVTDFVRETRL